MRLVVVRTFNTAGNPIADGCSACLEITPPGGATLMVDDGEYDPSFCLRCVHTAFEELLRADMATAANSPPGPTAPSRTGA